MIALFFFLCLSIPSYSYLTPCLFIHQLIDIHIVFIFWLRWIMLLFVCEFLCGCTFFNYLGYIEVELLEHVVTVCLTFWETTQNCFPKWLPHFPFPPGRNEGSNFSTTFPTLVHLFYYSHTNKVVRYHNSDLSSRKT